jgi:O-antigen ligase
VRPAAAATAWVMDDRYSWAVALMLYLLLYYMSVPYFIFKPPDAQAIVFGETNVFYRVLKILALGSGLVVLVWRFKLATRVLRELNIFFVAFVALVLLSVTWSIEPAITLTRFIAVLTICLVCGAAVLTGWQPRRFQQVVLPFFTLLMVGSLLFGIVAPDLAKENGTGISLANAWHGLFIQKNGLGHAASITLFFWTHAWLSRQTSVRNFLLGGGSALACLILSRSSTSLFATLFVIGLLVLLLKWPRRKRRYMVVVVVAFVSIILIYSMAVLDIVPGLEVVLQPIVSLTGKDMTFSGRTQIWEVIREHIVQHPILGTGYGAYWIGRVPTSPSYVFISRKSNFYPTEAHNGYLDIMNDLGYVGLLCLIGYLIVFLRQSVRLLKIDYVQATLYLALLFEELINNLSESDWLSSSSFSFVVFTFATFALARALLDHKFSALAQAAAQPVPQPQPAPAPANRRGAARRRRARWR